MKGSVLAAAAAAAAVAGGARYCYHSVFTVDKARCSDPKKPDTDPQYLAIEDDLMAQVDRAAALPWEQVQIRSHDGLMLAARYYETAPGAPVQIQCHGYRGNPIRDFCMGLPFALECGCNVLLIDERAHGKSEGKCLSFGILEREDVRDWVNYVRLRFGEQTPVILYGVSMGAATVMMTADLGLPDNVKGIIADCGYNSPKAILNEVMTACGLPRRLLYPMVRLAGRLYGGFDVESASAEASLARTDIPVLFIHGDDDRFVPCWMSQRNYEVCTARKKLVLIPGAPHAASCIVNPTMYQDAIRDFLREVGVTKEEEPHE